MSLLNKVFWIIAFISEWFEKNSLEIQDSIHRLEIVIVLVTAIGGFAATINEALGTVIIGIAFLGYIIRHILNISKCLRSCRRYLIYMVSDAFLLPVLLLLIFYIVLSLRNKGLTTQPSFFSNPLSALIAYAVYMILYGIVWIFTGLIVDKDVARLANSIFSACLTVLITVANFLITSFPWKFLTDASFQHFGLVTREPLHLEVIQFLFNLVTIPFVLIGVLSILTIDIYDYWKKKMGLHAD
ncbi:hypothetical protein U6B65_14675 (plasmid) [Oscillospiraceae bacterium MB08-C2-2]|nr:hypothetical protein U6B65_14675 [Oscillospiraceae bacterium MB08-C2-2]